MHAACPEALCKLSGTLCDPDCGMACEHLTIQPTWKDKSLKSAESMSLALDAQFLRQVKVFIEKL